MERLSIEKLWVQKLRLEKLRLQRPMVEELRVEKRRAGLVSGGRGIEVREARKWQQLAGEGANRKRKPGQF